MIKVQVYYIYDVDWMYPGNPFLSTFIDVIPSSSCFVIYVKPISQARSGVYESQIRKKILIASTPSLDNFPVL